MSEHRRPLPFHFLSSTFRIFSANSSIVYGLDKYKRLTCLTRELARLDSDGADRMLPE